MRNYQLIPLVSLSVLLYYLVSPHILSLIERTNELCSQVWVFWPITRQRNISFEFRLGPFSVKIYELLCKFIEIIRSWFRSCCCALDLFWVFSGDFLLL